MTENTIYDFELGQAVYTKREFKFKIEDITLRAGEGRDATLRIGEGRVGRVSRLIGEPLNDVLVRFDLGNCISIEADYKPFMLGAILGANNCEESSEEVET
jgi:hypothetical protein